MFRKRSTLALGGAALAAFLAFLVVGGRDEQPSSGEDQSAATGPGSRAGRAGGTVVGLHDREEAPGRRAAARLEARARKKAGGRQEKAPDPELVKRLDVPGGLLAASGPPESPKPGIVQRSFTGTRAVRGGAGVGARAGANGRDGVTGDSGERGKHGTEETRVDCPQCESTAVRSMIVDIVKQPVFNGAFEQTCSSTFITAGFGEQFEIGGEPACVIFVPESCRGSASALFEKRFFVTVTGECIPSRDFLKSVLQR